MGSVKKTETGSALNFNTYLPKNLDETNILDGVLGGVYQKWVN